MIDVLGSLEHPRDAAANLAIKAFRSWLVTRHGEAGSRAGLGLVVVVRCVFRADSLGRAWVTVVPAQPLAKEPGGLGTADQAILLQRESEVIGRMWRKMVSWGH
jgi:hypothetical protein